jgi:hypothetical protein
MVAGQTDGGKSDFILVITRLKTEGTLLPLSMTVAQRRSGFDGGKKNNFCLIISKPQDFQKKCAGHENVRTVLVYSFNWNIFLLRPVFNNFRSRCAQKSMHVSVYSGC